MIWDAFADNWYISHPFLALATANGPVMAYINGLVDHQGKIACWLYCLFPGHHKGSHYYPVHLKPDNNTIPDNNRDDVNLSKFAVNTFSNYNESLELLSSSHTLADYKQHQLSTGIIKPGIFLGLQQDHMLDIPQ